MVPQLSLSRSRLEWPVRQRVRLSMQRPLATKAPGNQRSFTVWPGSGCVARQEVQHASTLERLKHPSRSWVRHCTASRSTMPWRSMGRTFQAPIPVMLGVSRGGHCGSFPSESTTSQAHAPASSRSRRTPQRTATSRGRCGAVISDL